MAAFLTGIGVILILVFGMFDWTYYDEVIRIALAIIGLGIWLAVIGLFAAGDGASLSRQWSCSRWSWKPVSRWSAASWLGGIRPSDAWNSG